jgi:hypothetical protein
MTELEIITEKAKKYDELAAKIAACYEDEEGDYGEDEEGADLLTIGEIAASHFGYLG